MNVITSRQNPLVQELLSLNRDAGERRSRGLFLCEGEKLFREAVTSGVKPLFLAVAENRVTELKECISIAENEKIPINIMSDRLISLISDVKTAQGLIFTAPRSVTDKLPDSGSFIALEEIRDPGNMGTILRSASAFGIRTAVLCGSCADAFSPKVVRASMGAIFRIGIVETNLSGLSRELRMRGISLYGAVARGGAMPCDIDYQNACIIIGGEARGLCTEALGICDGTVTIPMPGDAESLNAGVAASILMYEMMKRKA